MHVGEGITGWVAQHQQPVALSSHAAEDPRFKRVPVIVEDTYEAFLSFPVVSLGRTVAVINLHHRDRHEHSAAEMEALTFIAEQVGGAIDKTLLADENRRLAELDRKLELERAALEREVTRRTVELELAKEKAEEATRLKRPVPGEHEP